MDDKNKLHYVLDNNITKKTKSSTKQVRPCYKLLNNYHVQYKSCFFFDDIIDISKIQLDEDNEMKEIIFG